MKTNCIFLLIASTILISCGEDRRKEYIGLTLTDRWIEEQMRENYYWYADMPASNGLNYFLPGDQFFKGLLSKKDAFSAIKDLSTDNTTTTRSTIETTYGMVLEYHTNPAKTSEFFARVLYTIKESPAEIKGIKRGDWIFSIDGASITSKNRDYLVKGKGIKVAVGEVDEKKVPIEPKRFITIEAAQSIPNNPIYYYNTYKRDDKKIGYLVYNSFVSGEDNDNRYNDELAKISNEFKAANVNEFILDLRYNFGGELNRPVPLLCTMLVPAKEIGKTMGYVKYNDKREVDNWQLNFSEEHLNGGSNLVLNKDKLYIITGKITASASEAVINFLDPHTEVIRIGAKTVGKYVGSEVITQDTIPWALHPIVARIYNSEEVTGEEGGFAPKYPINEGDSINLLPLGDEKETLLFTAISLIDGTYVAPGTTRSNPINTQPSGSSLDRKALPGAILLKR